MGKEQPDVVDLSDSRSTSEEIPREDLDEQPEAGKEVKMRDLDAVLRGGGEIRKCSKLTESKSDGQENREEETSQVTDAAPMHLDKATGSVMSNYPAERPNDLHLRLGLADSVESSQILASSVTQRHQNKVPDSQLTSAGLGLDLNDHNPFHPYKKLGQMRSTDASECGSTTGPLEENDPWKMWKEMKQNGFLSSSHGGIPVPAPKQRARPPKRRKDEEHKRKIEMTKREAPHKYTKVAAPTGLLSGLNPGIIKHVRNSKQVNSIIEAMLQSEQSANHMQSRLTDPVGGGSRDVAAHSSAASQISLYLNRSSFLAGALHGNQMVESDTMGKFYREGSAMPKFNPVYDDSLTLKLSSALSMASENASTTSNSEFSASHDAIASLSFKGASVAAQWLDLLQQDIKGRLAALRRSKKRVRNVIQTELPYLLSKEMMSNQDNEGYFAHTFEGGCSKKAILDMHMARWKSIFSQMDKALYEEGKHLESWLKQVEDMQSHCEGGLKYACTNHTPLFGEEFSGLKKTEPQVEKENAVRAAAASIYSTCNFIMTKENVPCF